jgi:hypothetical protein
MQLSLLEEVDLRDQGLALSLQRLHPFPFLPFIRSCPLAQNIIQRTAEEARVFIDLILALLNTMEDPVLVEQLLVRQQKFLFLFVEKMHLLKFAVFVGQVEEEGQNSLQFGLGCFLFDGRVAFEQS